MAKIICTVTNDLSHDQRMIRICGSLASAGHNVCLVGRQKTNSPALTGRSFRQIRLKCWFEKGKLFYIEYNLRLLFFLLRNKTDILNPIDLDTLLPSFIAGKISRKTIVFDAHEYFSETPEVVNRPLTKKIWEIVGNSIIPRLNYCYTVGPALAELFSEKYQVPFEVIRNVPYRAKMEVRAVSTPKIILYQGMLNEGRGLETAISSLALLDDNFELWLAGKGDIEEKLKQLVVELKLDKKVKFLGFIPPDQLPDLTKKAWVGLNLLESKGLSYYYSLANKAFDYIQSGLPSVQMEFPEYQKLEEQYQVFQLMKNLDPKALSVIIQGLADDPNKYQKITQNCSYAAEVLCWEQEEKTLLSFYRQISEKEEFVQ